MNTGNRCRRVPCNFHRAWRGNLGGLAVVVLMGTGRAWAGGFSIDEQDAAATGRGGTAGARSEASSTYYNPAGLSGLAPLEAEVGATGIAPSATATDPSGEASHTEGALFVPPYAYLAGSWGGLGWGLSFNAPFGLGVTWPATFEDRYEVESASFQSLAVMAGAAYRIIPSLSVGLTAGAVHTSLDIRKAIDFVTNDGQAELAGGGWGFAGGAGVLLKAAPWLTLGLTGFLPTPTSIQGSARFSDVPASFGPLTNDQGISTRVVLPARFRLAGTAQLSAAFGVDVDLEYTLWSAFRSFDVTFADPATPEIDDAKDWRNTVTGRLGAEYDLPGIATLRAGVGFDGQAAPASTLGPDSPDGDRLQFSVGAGRTLGAGLRADLAYALVDLLGATSSEPNFPARYQGFAQILALSVSWGAAPAVAPTPGSP